MADQVSEITPPARLAGLHETRKSLVSHYMPLGVMATFYDFSSIDYVKYPEGGYRIDRIKPTQA